MTSLKPGDSYPVARPIEDVMADIDNLMMPKLPGGRDRQALWGAYCHARAEYLFALGVVKEEGKDASDSFLWIHHGRLSACMGMIHKIADGLKVETVAWKQYEVAEMTVPET